VTVFRSYTTLLVAALRLNKPTGSILLAIPLILALLISNLSVFLGVILVLYSILARSLGCVINDYCDRDIDCYVQRTMDRPFAQKLLSTKDFIAISTTLSLLCLSSLFFIPPHAYITCMMSLAWIVLYALAKRWFIAPQIILGLAFSWSIFVVASIDNALISNDYHTLFIASVFWVSGFDTTYALSDLKDDYRLPIYSLPKTLGERLSLFFSAGTLILSQWLMIHLKTPFVFMPLSSFFIIWMITKIFHPKYNRQNIFHHHCILGLLWIFELMLHPYTTDWIAIIFK